MLYYRDFSQQAKNRSLSLSRSLLSFLAYFFFFFYIRFFLARISATTICSYLIRQVYKIFSRISSVPVKFYFVIKSNRFFASAVLFDLTVL